MAREKRQPKYPGFTRMSDGEIKAYLEEFRKKTRLSFPPNFDLLEDFFFGRLPEEYKE